MSESEKIFRLSCASPGSPCSYEMDGDYIVVRLFGFFQVSKIHLGAVHYLRLATRNDAPAVYLLINWPSFLPARRPSRQPVYILQSRDGHRTFLKMDSSAHFRLRNAIAHYTNHQIDQLAA